MTQLQYVNGRRTVRPVMFDALTHGRATTAVAPNGMRVRIHGTRVG